jgi:hypothetical protein
MLNEFSESPLHTGDRTKNGCGRPISLDDKSVDAFWEWFGESKMVNERGQPLVLYHGTTHDVEAFRITSSVGARGTALGNGFYFTQKTDMASYYATQKMQGQRSPAKREIADGGNIMSVYLSIERPLIWSAFMDSAEVAERIKTGVNDGIVFVDTATGLIQEAVVYRPEQIKSAIGNSGLFSRTSPLLSDHPSKQAARLENSILSNPSFSAWFGSSKVVDRDGLPTPVYHGTRKSFDEFSIDASNVADAFYFAGAPSAADNYARNADGDYEEGSAIVPVYLSLQNPMIVDRKGAEDLDGLLEYIEVAKSNGRDGLIARNTNDGYGLVDQFVAFHPLQIKSAVGNSGEFARGSPSLTDATPSPTHDSRIGWGAYRRAKAAIQEEGDIRFSASRRPS